MLEIGKAKADAIKTKLDQDPDLDFNGWFILTGEWPVSIDSHLTAAKL